MKNILLIFLGLNLIIALLPSAVLSQSITDAIQSSYKNQARTKTESSAASTAVSPAASEEIFYAIQTGYFLSASNADRQIEQLKAKGFAPYVFKSKNSKGKEIFSVRVGKYASYKEASNALTDLKKTIPTPMIITRYNSLLAGNAVKIAAAVSAAPSHSSEPAAPAEKTASSATAKESAADIKPAPPEKPLTMKEMQEKIQSLEQSMQRMKGETDIRNQLKVTEEEASAQEKDILQAAGQEYTLTQAGIVQFTYGLGYSYAGYDAIAQSTRVEDVADHTISNSFGVSYGVKNNLSLGTSIPFVYAYQKVGTVNSLSATDLGDLSLSWNYQPIKSSADTPTVIVNGSFGVPVGRDPYKIQPGKELSTSSGIYSTGLGVSVSQVSDPVITFSSFSVSYPFATKRIDQKRTEGILDEVDPGMGLGAAVGMGYALSYKLNLNMSFSYSYSFSTTYKYQNAPNARSGDATGASINIGTGYKFSRDQNMNFTIGIPITTTRSFSLSFSTPIDFAL